MALRRLSTLAIILTTYNRPDALRLILLALADQTELPNEVILADDGSTYETHDLITQLKNQLPFPIKHSWQADKGFRAAKIRNSAALKSESDYFIFLDGDCIPFPDFIAKHKQLMETGWFVSGHRILLNKKFTQKVLNYSLPINHAKTLQFLGHYFARRTNRLFPLMRLNLKKYRKKQAKRWQGAKSCNLGIWKKDFFSVNGFDENFIGWGYEDSDLIIRLIRSGILRKSGKYAIPVMHLWHAHNDRLQEAINYKRLVETKKNTGTRATIGIDALV
ncbi:MAG: glycosyltransferase family 2 protein [Rickettsiella sp.]|nr:glycosyltransferase family 2 protein [Rickettsiella sp.]